MLTLPRTELPVGGEVIDREALVPQLDNESKIVDGKLLQRRQKQVPTFF
jgi:hypothetical protein